MSVTRRNLLAAPLLQTFGSTVPPRWSTKWDKAILNAAVDRLNPRFDPAENLLRQEIGPEYQYHTSLRSTAAHPTRESLEYALLLMEAAGHQQVERVSAIIDHTLKLQDTDAASNWYGLWGYYLEEPAPKMSPADWNWADFLGSTLLMIDLRHGQKLSGPLRQRVREGIHHAAYSVRKRNVSMNYTNIAVQGTFVTLAAAQVLGDEDLAKYARERLVRFARTVDETGSFAEYNSPTYSNVTIANLTRIRMFVKDEESRKLARKIEQRAWLQLGRHWHSPTQQLGGPMSRCYQTDIGQPAWIQKALDGGVPVLRFEEIAKANVPGEVAMLEYNCPESAAGGFLSFGTSRQYREMFAAAPPEVIPLQGTTWSRMECCLGSVNRGNFWVQSRPLLAYWGDDSRPARYLQARVLKDDYDFASALLYSTQEENYILGAVTFRNPGGDKHPTLDPVKDGQFTCSRLRLRFDLAGVPFNAPIFVNGKLIESGQFAPDSRVVVDLGEMYLWLHAPSTRFGEPAGAVTVERESGLLTVSVDFLNEARPRVVRWPRIAYSLFTLAMHDSSLPSPEEYDRRMQLLHFEMATGTRVAAIWDAGGSRMGLAASNAVDDVAVLDRAFRETRDGNIVPLERLSNQRLL